VALPDHFSPNNAMLNNYDNVAGFYDFLSKLVFGDRLLSAQTCLIPFIPASSSILIVGGGTGTLLEEIAQRHPEGLRIIYVEISSAMIEQAKNRDYGGNQVVFINQAIEDFGSNERFDILFTPFLFDNFDEKRVNRVVSLLSGYLRNDGLWLFADFHLEPESPVWQRGLLKSMIGFFALVCNIESRGLVPMDPVFSKFGFTPLARFNRCKKFIKSVVYKSMA
jgi:ubiquinone/menaquinone biosynthesis C-methylase UbiE